MQHPKALPNADYLGTYRTIGYLPNGHHRNPSRFDSFLGGLALAIFGTFIQLLGAISLVCRRAVKFAFIAVMLLSRVAVPLFKLQLVRAVKEAAGFCASMSGLFVGMFILFGSVLWQLAVWFPNAAVFVYMGARGNVMRIAYIEVHEVGEGAPL